MAKKVKAQAAKKEPPKGVQITLKPDATIDSKRMYANYALIDHSPFDFTIRFCDAPPAHDTDLGSQQGEIELRIPVVAEIALPPNLIGGLIRALQEQLEQYESHFGFNATKTKTNGKKK